MNQRQVAQVTPCEHCWYTEGHHPGCLMLRRDPLPEHRAIMERYGYALRGVTWVTPERQGRLWR